MKVNENPIKFSTEHRRILLVMIALGVMALTFGWFKDAKRTWLTLLLTNVYFIMLGVSGLFFLSLQYITGARWSILLLKIPEAISRTLIYTSVPMLALFFGMHSLYHWADDHELENDKLLQSKSWYLNVPFFFARMVIILGTWLFFSRLFSRYSKEEDAHGGHAFHRKKITLSAIFMIVFAISFSMSSFDWVMSLDPHWYSTIFAIYNFSGMFVNGLVVITLVSILLFEMGKLPMLKEDHVHDLAKLIFAFTFFWAYIWYSQFVLIWYGNIPEETVYYVNRTEFDWDWLFYVNFAINFVIPFFILLPRGTKRNLAIVKRVCILLLVGRWLDLYVMVAPGVLRRQANIGVVEIFVALGFSGAFILLLKRQLSKQALIPLNSPYLEDSLHHHQ